MNKSETIGALAEALANAQAEIENAAKASVNPHLKNKYADLAEILNTVRPVFARHGLSISQLPGFEDGKVNVETLLLHKSGEWISSVLCGPCAKQDAQGVGSAITYYRRYSLAAIAGISQEDDDGNAAAGKGDQGGQGNQGRQNRQQQNNQQPPAPKLASGAQVAKIRAGLTAAEVSEADFCAAQQIGSVEELPESRVNAVIKRLTEKVNAKKAGTDSAAA
ncbi:ERF family protein [uncultured Pseudomonas sp.]|uniref:ERF family protein n=1 Tax=uncultured Pseudomonas sp. TaxID=114707 RepID=UPI0025FC47DD|nr:ERF family protein [uncultured Pseudomonas sp.]